MERLTYMLLHHSGLVLTCKWEIYSSACACLFIVSVCAHASEVKTYVHVCFSVRVRALAPRTLVLADGSWVCCSKPVPAREGHEKRWTQVGCEPETFDFKDRNGANPWSHSRNHKKWRQWCHMKNMDTDNPGVCRSVICRGTAFTYPPENLFCLSLLFLFPTLRWFSIDRLEWINLE